MGVPEISVQEAHERLSSSTPPRLIDVREEDEWEHCRIEGAELLPLSHFPTAPLEKLTDRAQPLLIYCHHGSRSSHATDFLLRQGFTDVTNVAGGIHAWSCEIDPTIPIY